MGKVNLVAESLNNWKENQPVELNKELTEEQINEGLYRKWKKLDKDDDEAVRAFASKIGKDVKGDPGLKTIAVAIKKAKIDSLKQLLAKAAEDKFKGKLRPAGKSFVYRPAKDRKVASEFAGRGNSRKNFSRRRIISVFF